MAITSEIIGKLGGADVEQIPVDVSVTGDKGTEEVFHTVEIPEGETWLVAVFGNLTSHYDGTSSAVQIHIGTTVLGDRAYSGITGLAHVGTGTTVVKMRRNGSSGTDYFTGHVYAVKL